MQKLLFALCWVPACVAVCAFLPFSALAQTSLGAVNIGSSTATTVAVTIPAAATVTNIAVLTQGAANLDFTNAGGGTCTTGTAYAAKATCTVKVTFKPKYSGSRYGAVVLEDASGVIATEYLHGTGVGPQATFLPGAESTVDSAVGWPGGVAVDGSGNVYVTDNNQGLLYKETLSGGSYTRSTVPTSKLGDPNGVAVDGSGNIYVADDDLNDFRILKETPTASSYIESTVASFPVLYGAAPVGVAVDGAGNVYLSLGVEGGIVYKETPTANGYIQSTVVSGLPADAEIAVDGNGAVYIAVDETNAGIVKETPSAGGYTQSTIPVSGGGVPFGVAVDGSGNVYVAYTGNNDKGQIFKMTPSAGGYTQSTMPSGTLDQPEGVAVDGGGNVYIANSGYYEVLKEDFANPPSLTFAATHFGVTGSNSPQTVTVANIGNANLKFSALSYPADFPENNSETGNCTSSTSLAAGETCALSIDFTPMEALDGKTSLALSEMVTVTTDTLNTSATRQAVTVTGTETSAVPAATPALSRPPGIYPSAQSVALTDATKGAAIYYTTNGMTPTASSTLYTGPITITQTATIKAIAKAPYYLNSAIASATYTINPPAATPVFSLATGIYTSVQTVAITDTTIGATIYYTTNGTAPSASATRYIAPIIVNAPETVKAIAVAANYTNSAIASASYTLVGSPTALAAPATAISTPDATLNAIVNTQGLAGSYVFQYGTSSAALTSTTAKTTLGASTLAQSVNTQLTGLKAKTRYYYQVVVTTTGGTGTGAMLSFTTN